MGRTMVSASEARLTSIERAAQGLRPLALVVAFVWLSARAPWWASAPLALGAVFAWSIFVHDMIHNSLHFPRPLADVFLGVSALFMIKSGHALRALHMRHHRQCLDEHDFEGNVVFVPFFTLLLRGPALAVRARGEAWRLDPRTRPWQAVETALNAVFLGALIFCGFALHRPAALSYWGSVVFVTCTAPLWGAKIPHMLPYRHPLVRRLTRLTGRLTPGVASLLLHELHHRRPGLPSALLAAHGHELESGTASDCAGRMGHDLITK
jgi:hypothetical protein